MEEQLIQEAAPLEQVIESAPVRVTRGTVDLIRKISAEGLSQYAAAKESEVDQSGLGKILRDGRVPGPKTMQKLFARFDTKPELWLVDATDEERADWERLMRAMKERQIAALTGKAAS